MVLLFLLSGCTDSTVQAPRQTDSAGETVAPAETRAVRTLPPTTEPPLPPPKYELYFIASTGSSTQTLKGQTEWDYGTLHQYGYTYSGTSTTKGYSLFKLNPVAENITEIQHFTSPSYSSNWARVKTIDGEVFLIRHWGSGDEIIGYGGAASFSRSAQISSWTVVGEKMYFRTEREYDMSLAYSKPWTGGYSGGELKFCCDRTKGYAQSKTLISYEDEHNFGTLDSAGGNLYSFFSLEEQGEYAWGIYRRDLSTGKSVEGIGQYILDSWEKNFLGSFGRDYFYYSYDDLNEGTTNLGRISLVDGKIEYPIYTRERGAPTYIDADGALVMLQFVNKDADDLVVVYDDETGTAEEIPSPTEGGKIEILSTGSF